MSEAPTCSAHMAPVGPVVGRPRSRPDDGMIGNVKTDTADEARSPAPRRSRPLANLSRYVAVALVLVVLGALVGAGYVVTGTHWSGAAGSKHPRLSNGCAYTERGIPACGAYLGAAIGGNSDPAPFEKDMGQQLGVRRTYYSAGQVLRAVKTAQADLAAGRLPWISFKLPASWAQMAGGAGDEWARDLSRQLAELDGPVWVAFHHEPEGDGPIGDWTRTQERLGPIVRRTAPNLAFTIILTGWNQLRGPPEYSLASIWPDTKVDVAGFDVYDHEYTVKDGVLRTDPFDIKSEYFEPIADFVKSRGSHWGLAETGYSDRAAQHDKDWIRRTYGELKATGGIAMAYFNSRLNSTQASVLENASKQADFKAALKGSATLPSSR